MFPEQVMCAVPLCCEQREVLQCVVCNVAAHGVQFMAWGAWWLVCSAWCAGRTAWCAFLAVQGNVRMQMGLLGKSSRVSTLSLTWAV